MSNYKVKKKYSSRSNAMRALRRVCTNTCESYGTIGFATFWVKGDTLFGTSGYHHTETLEEMLAGKYL